MVATPSLVLVANSSALHRRRAWAARSRAPVTGFASFNAETDRNSIIRSRRSKNDTRSCPAQPPDIMAAPTRELATVPLINLSRNCYCRFAFSRTPGPPPFSGMNSMPAVSRAVAPPQKKSPPRPKLGRLSAARRASPRQDANAGVSRSSAGIARTNGWDRHRDTPPRQPFTLRTKHEHTSR
jgi:hypothetical protein